MLGLGFDAPCYTARQRRILHEKGALGPLRDTDVTLSQGLFPYECS